MKVNGEAVRAIRRAQRRSMRELASAAEIDVGYLSKIENGRKGASSDTITRLAGALECTVGAISYAVPQASPSAIRQIVQLLEGPSSDENEHEPVGSPR